MIDPAVIDPLNWQHILTEGAVYLIPTVLLGWLGYRKLMWTLGEFRPHLHEEESGALHAERIRYPRNMNGSH